MVRKNYIKEIVLLVIAYAWLLFTATNVNIVLGQTYLHFAQVSAILLIIGILIFDKNLKLTFQKSPGGTLKSIGWGLVGYVILLLFSVFVMGFVEPAKAGISSIIKLLGATTPVLAQSKWANFLSFGFAIAFVETILWVRAMEFISDLFKINIDRKNIRDLSYIILISILSFIFAIFHLTAKGVTAFASLIVVFIMMMISLIMTAYFRESRQAVWLHIIANSVASAILLGII